jgi:hypothetical protein
MFLNSMARTSLKMLLIFSASVIAGTQTQAAERQSLPQRGSEKYWLVVDEFADRAIHFAYAKRFVQLHERSHTDRQCQQYARIAANYADQLAAVGRAGVSAESEFWNDVREYSIRMIGTPGVPIPVHRSSKYWVTTGSEEEDRELRRIVSLEIDEASSQFVPTGEYSTSALSPECRSAGQEPTAKAQP